jgi:hypothetical protein
MRQLPRILHSARQTLRDACAFAHGAARSMEAHALRAEERKKNFCKSARMRRAMRCEAIAVVRRGATNERRRPAMRAQAEVDSNRARMSRM